MNYITEGHLLDHLLPTLSEATKELQKAEDWGKLLTE